MCSLCGNARPSLERGIFPVGIFFRVPRNFAASLVCSSLLPRCALLKIWSTFAGEQPTIVGDSTGLPTEGRKWGIEADVVADEF